MRSKLLLFFMFLAVSITAQVSQTERQALIDLYNATDGANWTNNTNWDTDPNSTSDVSTWFGVTITEISAQKYVTHIQLSDNNINGTIPSLVSLIKLETFDFSKNSLLTGPVNLDGYAASLANVLLHQTSISSLKLPHSLNLNIKTTPNLFCVEVPTTSLSHYYNLSMDNFDLGVKITDDCSSVLSLSVTERAALKTIYDATNGDSWSYRTYASTEITTGSGSVDVRGFETIDIAGERKITKLSFSGMNLNGPLPAEIDDFTELLELNLSSNSISSLPTEIGNLTKLLNLNINSNGSITTLPSVVGNLSELISLTFNSTQIDLIPTTLGDLKKLQTLEFGSTKITLLPPEIGGLIELKKLVAAPNNIASIPTEFGQLTKLTYLDFASCELSNTPAAFASLTELETLYLNDNELQVVAGLGGFTKLKYLRLHNNRLGEDNPNFNTDLPSDLGDLVLLEELTLNNNKLTSLPNSIGNLILLKVLPLQHNFLTSLPTTIGNLVNLEELRLSETYGSGGNELTSLPVEIGNLSSLKLLYVAGNKLTSLPDEIGNLSALEDFSIASNSEYDTSISDYVYHLTTLPATINNLTSLKSFRANDNHITGNIDLSNLLSLTDFQFSQNRITGLKIGGSPDRFGNGHFYLKNNPNLSCIEVDDATQITNWENSNHSNYIDNGVAYSDDCSGYTVPQAERDALISFYLATGGGLDTSDANTYWTGTFWDVDKATSISNVGAWEGVTTALVNGQKHVVNISLSKNLKGFIPSEIKDLTELQELHISTPNSSGLTEIKPEIGQLSKLTRMNLSGHELSSLPTDIGNLSSLVYLNVSNNELSSLPAGIGNFAKLEELHLENQESYDTTTGIREKTLTSLPDEIGNIASLKKLYLQHNFLTSLPTTIGNLVNLEELRLSETYGSGGNELTSLPVEIGNLSSLKLLYVAGNKLTSLPDEIGNLSALEDFSIASNSEYDTSISDYVYHLTTLPATINNLTSLKSFRANDNHITGNIDLSNLLSLTDFQFSQNRITGLKIGGSPDRFGNGHFYLKNNPNLSCIEVDDATQITNWENSNHSNYIDNGVAYSDDCSGYTVPQAERDALISFYLATGGGLDTSDANTYWTGTFWDVDKATSISNVGAWEGVTTALVNGQKHVVNISLSKNLKGFIPSEIKDLTELQELHISTPNSSGLTEIKPEIGQLSKLTRMNLSGHELSSLPTDIGNLSSLVYLNVSNNELSSLPAGIGNFAKLEELHLENQESYDTTTGIREKTLTSLPDEIGNIASLKKLYLQHNSLTSLPSTIGGLVNLEELRLSGTSGSGGNELTSLPVEIGNLSSLKLLYVAGNKLTSLPDEIGNLSALEDFSITSNSEYDTSISDYVYHLTTLPATINNLTSLKSFRANDNHITGNIDLSNLLSLTDFQFSQNRITGLKIGGSPDRFGNGHFYLKNNPNLSCIEVDDATQITNWENSNHSNYIDNGVAYSDDCSGYTVPQAERDALISFYLATGGGLDTSDANTYWTGTFWDVDKATSISNVGAWEGVTTALVNGQKHVVNISLSKNLKGFIPSEIKDLTELQELHISTPNSSGLTEIKPEIGQLSKLTRMNLSGHELSSLPTDIGNLSSLVYLNVSNNELSSLPAGIGNFAKLEELHLENQESYDTTTGIREKTLTSLPDEIGNIVSLKKLYLQYNSLTSLPSTIGGLVNLENLNIENNKLTELPISINNLTMLDELIANNNIITGSLDLSNLKVIDRLKLEYNHIENLKLNVAPTAFNIGSDGNSNSYYFSIIRNAIGCIEVPTDELISWQLSDASKEKLRFIDNGVIYSDNCSAVTNNSIPDLEREALIALYNSTKGTDWKNDLSGSYNGVTWVADATQKRNVGAWFGVTTEMINGQKHVTKIELNSNLLDGTIPSVIKNLTQLKELEFNNNSVSEIASEIGELANLEQLTFTSQYDSSKSEYVLKNIPSEINNITSLKRLEMSSNQLEGNLDFSNLTNLDNLSVSSNQITGLKIGISPNVFDNSYNSEGQYSRSFSFSSNQYLNCIAVPQYTIADWEATTFAQQRPNIVWGLDCSTYNNVPEGEIQALVDMYNNLDGANWTSNTNWTGDLAKATINSPYNATKWQGVTTEIIDGAKHISRISLYNNKIKGEFSTSFGNLSKLKYLQMSSNELSGSIPASFGNLNSLEEIHLNNNQLTSLPSELSNLSNLKTVYFQDNELSGKVPDLSGITSLQTLYLSSNKFQFGDFEDEFTDYQNLTTFIYSPQAKVGVEEEKSFGTSGFTLEAEVNGLNNEYQWYKNGSKITDAINKTLEISEASAADNGYYFCYVTNTVVTSLTIQTENVTLTYDASLSIDNNEFSKAIKLFPNPVNDILQIRNSNNVAINKIEIFNTLGKRVQVLNEPKIFINVSSLPKGIYLMNIISEKGVTTKRIVKK